MDEQEREDLRERRREWGRKGQAALQAKHPEHHQRNGEITAAKMPQAHYVAMGKKSAQKRADIRASASLPEAYSDAAQDS